MIGDYQVNKMLVWPLEIKVIPNYSLNIYHRAKIV